MRSVFILLALAGCAARPSALVPVPPAPPAPATIVLPGKVVSVVTKGQTTIITKVVTAPCTLRTRVPPEPPLIGMLPIDARAAADVLAAKDLELRRWGRIVVEKEGTCGK